MQEQAQEQEYEIPIVIYNIHDTNATLILEPWGQPYEIPPQANYTIIFRSHVKPVPSNTVEIEYGSNHIVVYGWTGCLYDIYHNGELIN